MIKNQAFKFLILSIMTIVISGCLNRDMSDLEKKVKEIKDKKNVKVTALPIYKPTFQAIYKGGKNPFESFMQSKTAINNDESLIKNKICPKQPRSTYRVQTGLEKFPLDSLRMRGSFQDHNGILWALVVDPENVMHTVKEGYFMGQNFGKIIVVSEDKIELEEKYPDEKVCWITKETKISLTKSKDD